MIEAQAGGDSDQPPQSRRDTDLLLRVIDFVSERIVGSQRDGIAEDLSNHLGSVPRVKAVGVWLVDPDTGSPVLRTWNGTLSEERGDEVRPIAESWVKENFAETSPFQREAHDHVADQAGRPYIFALFPLHRGSTLSLGMILLVCQRRLAEVEMSALSVLARQVSAEIGGMADDKRAARSKPANAEPGSSTQFIALIAHELRTPLTALRGNVQLASMSVRKGDLARIDARLQAALKGVDGIASLVQNLQDMSHLERGKFQLARVKGDLTTTVRNAAKRAERLIESGHSTIRVETPSEAESYFDPARIEQAVFNILVNALQYSPDGSTVVVHVECDEQEAVVSISDNGIGIPSEEQQQIFEPYYRGSMARTTNAKGLGLGLTISRATAERHGGSLGLQSTVGSGSTFSLHLPNTGTEHHH